MKILTHLAVALLLSCSAGCQSKFVKVGDSDINKARLVFATDLSKKILSAQKGGGFYNLSEVEASPEMKSALNESLQKKSYQQIKSAFGDYQDLTFDHLMKPTDGTLFEIYRFRGKFNPGADVEVRTVLDADGKLAGFFVKPWHDAM
jgi:hypothetical protein